MRIKRQRRKLRGKYSGNCLSCAAKWSKCWYIASVENQAEWQTRLAKTVTPYADEVCFQCWDAKIRTSPKRKVHFKAELPAVAEDIVSANSTQRPSKRVGRNKRRALDNEDYAYTSQSPSDESKQQAYDISDEDEEGYYVEDDSDGMPAAFSTSSSSASSSRIYKESVILDEENAVMLLSTAFHSIPGGDIDTININISARYHVSEVQAFDMPLKKRGANCARCGKFKKGHVCDMPTSAQLLPPSSLDSLTSSQSSVIILPPLPLQPPPIPLQPLLQPQPAGVLPALTALAQPVGS